MSMRPHHLIAKFLFIASLDVLKEPLIGSAYKVLRVPPDSVPPDSLALCPFYWLRSQTLVASFCSFAPGTQEPLGCPGQWWTVWDFIWISKRSTYLNCDTLKFDINSPMQFSLTRFVVPKNEFIYWNIVEKWTEL